MLPNFLWYLGCRYPDQTDCYACPDRLDCHLVLLGQKIRQLQREVESLIPRDEPKQDAVDGLTEEVFDRLGRMIAGQLIAPDAPSVRVVAICRAVAYWVLRRDAKRDAKRGVVRD